VKVRRRGKSGRRQNAAKNRLAPVEESDIAGTDFSSAGMKQENRKVAPCPAMGKEPFFIIFIP
jgi:hypothetical protein